MKNIIVLFVFKMFILYSIPLFSQQISLFNQSNVSSSLDNPAMISNNYFKYYTPTSIGLRYRSQWGKLKDAPRTYSGYFSQWNEDYNVLFGGSLISDRTGPLSYSGVYGKVGYGIQLSNNLLLNFGVIGGLVQYRVKGNELQFLEQGDIASENQTELYPDVGLGVMIYLDEKLYAGLSIPQTFGLNLSFDEKNDDFSIQRVQHYHLIAGAILDLGSDSWLEPSVEARYVENVPVYFYGKIRYEYDHLFWLAISGANNREISAELGLILDLGTASDVMTINGSFSHFFQNYGANFGSTYELGIGYFLSRN